jgi:hypothetical protein
VKYVYSYPDSEHIMPMNALLLVRLPEQAV